MECYDDDDLPDEWLTDDWMMNLPTWSTAHTATSLITYFIPTEAGTSRGTGLLGGVDLKTLRAIRVLRPLKLVSGVPSK